MWKIEYTIKAKKELFKLDSFVKKQIIKMIDEKLLSNPDKYLVSLTADLSGYYKFRVNDYRLICKKEDKVLTILIIKIKHRKEVYIS